MYKVTVFTLSPYKLDKNSAQNTHFVQNDRTVSRDCLEIRLERTWIENPRSIITLTRNEKKIFRHRERERVFSIALYISFLASLLNNRDIYKAKFISESRKS